MVKLFASRQHSKMFQTQIYPDRSHLWLRVIYLNLTPNRDEILTALGFRDGTVFHLAAGGPVEDSPNPSDFRQIDTRAVDLESLRIADRLRVVFALKLGVFCPAFKKVHKGAVKVFKRLLQDLTIGFFEPRSGTKPFEQGQHLGQVVVGDTFTIVGIVRITSSQTPVVDKPGMAELDRQFVLLLLGWVDAVLKRLFDFQCISSRLLSSQYQRWI